MIKIINNKDLTSTEKLLEKSVREDLSKKYFNNINPKYLRKMEYITPKNHEVTCYISKKPNYQLGSMVISKVDGVSTEHYVQGMPKIKYFDEYDDFKIPKSITEKLDGTNILLYFLHDPVTGNVIEVLAKTRNMPILSHEFNVLFEYLSFNKDSFLYYKDTLQSVAFELYGSENLHSIHYKEDLNLRLLTAFDKSGEQVHFSMLDYLSKLLDVPLPDNLFNVNYFPASGKYIVTFTVEAKKKYGNDLTSLKSYIYQDCNSMFDVYSLISLILEELNNKFETPIIEGVVVNTSFNGVNFQMKNKPPTIKENHTCSDGIPIKAIRKELNKFIDDFGKSEALEYMKNDRCVVYAYLTNNLLEEFTQSKIDMIETQKRIVTVINNKISCNLVNPEIKSIGLNLIKKYPNLTVKELMKKFSLDYPDLKKSSRKMFNVIQNEKNRVG